MQVGFQTVLAGALLAGLLPAQTTETFLFRAAGEADRVDVVLHVQRDASGQLLTARTEADALGRRVMLTATGAGRATEMNGQLELPLALAEQLLANPSQVKVSLDGSSVASFLERADFGTLTDSGNSLTVRSLVLRPEQFNPRAASVLADVSVSGTASAGPPVISALLPGTLEASTGQVAPGELIEITGTNFTSSRLDLRGWHGLAYPESLNGVSVKLGQVSARLLSVAPDRILAQVPMEAQMGLQRLTVVRDGRASLAASVEVAASAPSLYRMPDGAVALRESDRGLVSAQSPAGAGEVLVLFATGLGATSPALASGRIVEASEATSYQAEGVEVLFGDRQAQVLRTEAAPGLAGVYQITLRVPEDAGTAGEVRLRVRNTVSTAVALATVAAGSVVLPGTGRGLGTPERSATTPVPLASTTQTIGAIPYFSTAVGVSSTLLMWSPTTNGVGLGIATPEGGIHIKDFGGAGRTSLSLDTFKTNLRSRTLRYLTNGLARWSMGADQSPETGNNAGSQFTIDAFKDDGTFARTQLLMQRDTGHMLFVPNDPAASFVVGDTVPASSTKLTVRGTTTNIAKLISDTTLLDQPATVLTATALSSVAVTNGFGPQIQLSGQSATSGERAYAYLRASRDGTDDSGAFTIFNSINGTATQMFRVGGAGRVVIGKGSDNNVDAVQLVGDTRIRGKFYVNQLTPASSTAACKADQMSFDTNYVYVCISANRWRRIPLASW